VLPCLYRLDAIVGGVFLRASKVAPSLLKQPAKLFRLQAGGSHNHSHRVRIHWIVSWDRHNASPIGHHNVLPLPYDTEARLLKRPNGALVCDAGDGHGLPLYDDFPLFGTAAEFIGHGEVFVNRITDIVQCLGLGLTLRRTAWKTGHPHTEPLIGMQQRNGVAELSHSSENAKSRLRLQATSVTQIDGKQAVAV